MSGFLDTVTFAARFVTRDTRGTWARFLWFGLLLGTSLAVLMASQGAVSSLRTSIRASARELVGGDIVITSKTPIPSEVAERFGDRKALEYRIRTMVRSSTAAQLTQLRAIDESYPLFGGIETEPKESAWRSRGVVLERILMDRLGVKVGDQIEVLGISTTVAAELVSAPGDISAAYVVAPRLYFPRSMIPQSILSARGSMVDYTLFIALERDGEADRVAAELRSQLDPATYNIDTAVKRTERLSLVVSSIGSLASTVSLATMALALIAITLAIRFHLRSKRPVAAVLRATGASTRQIGLCFFGQTALLGLCATIFGIIGGLTLYDVCITIARTTFELNIAERLDPTTIATSVGFMLVSLLWAATPSIHHISSTPALSVLRSDLEAAPQSTLQHRLDLGIRLLSGFCIVALAWLLLGADKSAAILLGGAAVTLAVSVALAAVARWCAKRVGQRVDYFPLRCALRNLYRPGNQTLAVVSSITLALALSCAVFVVQSTLNALRGIGTDYGEANVFLYELSPEQAPLATQVVEKHGGRPLQQLPVVLMRLQSIKGAPITDILRKNEADAPPRWALTREYWTSYRDHLISNERITAGRWFDREHVDGEVVPISLEDALAERLGLSIGDTVEWDVQGVPVLTRVTSIRDILWERFERNSFVVFPPGVLEGAPQFLFWSLSIQDAAARSAFIKEIATLAPNVSVIDLTLVVREVLTILSTIGLALKILFGIIAFTAVGLLVITAMGARAERAPEFMVLARIGMRRPTKRSIVRFEFLLLGALATVCGIGLGLGVGWSIAHFALQVPVTFDWWSIAALSLATLILCWAAGRVVAS